MNGNTPSKRVGRTTPLQRTTDYARVLLRRAELALAALAVPVASAVGMIIAGTARRWDGVVAGVMTLAICWTLLTAAGIVWRRRLGRRDLRDWTDGWARVEPLWSDRPL